MLFRFIVYGLLGMAIEVLWTAFYEKVFEQKPGWDLKGTTYIWMFPIYGMILFFFEPLHILLDHFEVLWYWRYTIYMIGIFLVEYITGYYLSKLGKCPWDYTEQTSLQLHGLIRFDYAPLWFTLGWILEHLDDLLTKITPQVYSVF